MFSDLHLDAPFAWMGAGAAVARARRDAQRRVLQSIAALVAEEDAAALLCGGDLYEQEYFTPDTGAFLCQVFASIAPRRVFLAPGNHDWFGPDSLYATVRWPENVHIFREERLAPVALSEGLTLWGAAHRAPANTDGFLDDFRVKDGGIHIALFHGAEIGLLPFEGSSKRPHAPFRESQVAAAGLHHAFAGHYHRPRHSHLLTYPGNPEPLAFGEDGERGAVVATISGDGSITTLVHQVAETTVADLAIDVTGAASRTELLGMVSSRLSGARGVVRVILEGEIAQEVDFTPGDFEVLKPAAVDACQFVIKTQPAYDIETIATEKTVRGEFVREVQEANLDPDTTRRVLITGLRALAGRADLEVP